MERKQRLAFSSELGSDKSFAHERLPEEIIFQAKIRSTVFCCSSHQLRQRNRDCGLWFAETAKKNEINAPVLVATTRTRRLYCCWPRCHLPVSPHLQGRSMTGRL